MHHLVPKQRRNYFASAVGIANSVIVDVGQLGYQVIDDRMNESYASQMSAKLRSARVARVAFDSHFDKEHGEERGGEGDNLVDLDSIVV